MQCICDLDSLLPLVRVTDTHLKVVLIRFLSGGDVLGIQRGADPKPLQDSLHLSVLHPKMPFTHNQNDRRFSWLRNPSCSFRALHGSFYSISAQTWLVTKVISEVKVFSFCSEPGVSAGPIFASFLTTLQRNKKKHTDLSTNIYWSGLILQTCFCTRDKLASRRGTTFHSQILVIFLNLNVSNVFLSCPPFLTYFPWCLYLLHKHTLHHINLQAAQVYSCHAPWRALMQRIPGPKAHAAYGQRFMQPRCKNQDLGGSWVGLLTDCDWNLLSSGVW